jgi:hypothetical protein
MRLRLNRNMEEWLKHHRLLSAIGAVAGMIVALLAATQTIWSLIHSEPLLPYVLVNAPQWGRIVLAALFIAVCVFCVVVVMKVYRQGKKPHEREPQINAGEASQLEQIPNTLTLMHHRIRELREEVAKRDIGRERARRLQEKMNKTIPISDGTRKRIQGWQRAGQTARFVKGVELVNKWAVGDVYGSGYESQICDMGGILETEDAGLKSVLSSDAEYVSLKNRLEMQYAGVPKSIAKPILKYERYLYGLSSVFVWDAYRIRHLGKQLPTVVEAKITQYHPQAEDEILSKLKEDVANAIKAYVR